MLAEAYRRQDKPAQARDALRKIVRPDARVFLQMGLLSVQEGQLSQAEQEFSRAWHEEPTWFDAGHNLVLTRLALGQIEACVADLPRLRQLTDDPHAQRFLGNLLALLRSARGCNGDHTLDPALLELSAEDEEALLRLLRSLGRLDVAFELLKTLAAARPNSLPVQEAHIEVVLVRAK